MCAAKMQSNDYELDPNFAVICSFFENFGKYLGESYSDISIDELKTFLEEKRHVYCKDRLVKLHLKLLKDIGIYYGQDDLQKGLVKFACDFPERDDKILTQAGYCKAPIYVKLRLLKNLLEDQFEFSDLFNKKINGAIEENGNIRHEPVGKDRLGRTYWLLFDKQCCLHLYRGWRDDMTRNETWNLVCSEVEQLKAFIDELETFGEMKQEDPAICNAEKASHSLVSVDDDQSLDDDVAKALYSKVVSSPVFVKSPRLRTRKEILREEKDSNLKHCFVKIQILDKETLQSHTKHSDEWCKNDTNVYPVRVIDKTETSEIGTLARNDCLDADILGYGESSSKSVNIHVLEKPLISSSCINVRNECDGTRTFVTEKYLSDMVSEHKKEICTIANNNLVHGSTESDTQLIKDIRKLTFKKLGEQKVLSDSKSISSSQENFIKNTYCDKYTQNAVTTKSASERVVEEVISMPRKHNIQKTRFTNMIKANYYFDEFINKEPVVVIEKLNPLKVKSFSPKAVTTYHKSTTSKDSNVLLGMDPKPEPSCCSGSDIPGHDTCNVLVTVSEAISEKNTIHKVSIMSSDEKWTNASKQNSVFNNGVFQVISNEVNGKDCRFDIQRKAVEEVIQDVINLERNVPMVKRDKFACVRNSVDKGDLIDKIDGHVSQDLEQKVIDDALKDLIQLEEIIGQSSPLVSCKSTTANTISANDSFAKCIGTKNYKSFNEICVHANVSGSDTISDGNTNINETHLHEISIEKESKKNVTKTDKINTNCNCSKLENENHLELSKSIVNERVGAEKTKWLESRGFNIKQNIYEINKLFTEPALTSEKSELVTFSSVNEKEECIAKTLDMSNIFKEVLPKYKFSCDLGIIGEHCLEDKMGGNECEDSKVAFKLANIDATKLESNKVETTTVQSLDLHCKSDKLILLDDYKQTDGQKYEHSCELIGMNEQENFVVYENRLNTEKKSLEMNVDGELIRIEVASESSETDSDIEMSKNDCNHKAAQKSVSGYSQQSRIDINKDLMFGTDRKENLETSSVTSMRSREDTLSENTKELAKKALQSIVLRKTEIPSTQANIFPCLLPTANTLTSSVHATNLPIQYIGYSSLRSPLPGYQILGTLLNGPSATVSTNTILVPVISSGNAVSFGTLVQSKSNNNFTIYNSSIDATNIIHTPVSSGIKNVWNTGAANAGLIGPQMIVTPSGSPNIIPYQKYQTAKPTTSSNPVNTLQVNNSRVDKNVTITVGKGNLHYVNVPGNPSVYTELTNLATSALQDRDFNLTSGNERETTQTTSHQKLSNRDVKIRNMAMPLKPNVASKRKRKGKRDKDVVYYNDASSDSSFERLLESEMTSEQESDPDPDYDYHKISQRVQAAKDKRLPARRHFVENNAFDENQDVMKCNHNTSSLVLEQNARSAVVRQCMNYAESDDDIIEITDDESEVASNDANPCKVCNKSDDAETILMCDECNARYHMICLSPPMLLVPLHNWYCPECEQKKLIQVLKQKLYVVKNALRSKTRQNDSISQKTFSINPDNIMDEHYQGRLFRKRKEVNYNDCSFDAMIKNAVKDLSTETKGDRSQSSDSESTFKSKSNLKKKCSRKKKKGLQKRRMYTNKKHCLNDNREMPFECETNIEKNQSLIGNNGKIAKNISDIKEKKDKKRGKKYKKISLTKMNVRHLSGESDIDDKYLKSDKGFLSCLESDLEDKLENTYITSSGRKTKIISYCE